MKKLAFLFVFLSSIPSFCQEEKYSLYLVNGVSQTDPINNRIRYAFNFGVNRDFRLFENQLNERAYLTCGLDFGFNEGTPFYKPVEVSFPTYDGFFVLAGYNQHYKIGFNFGAGGIFNLKNSKLNFSTGLQPYKIFEAKRPPQPEAYVYAQTSYYHLNWVSSLGIKLEKHQLIDLISIEFSKGLTYLVSTSQHFQYKFFGIKLTKQL